MPPSQWGVTVRTCSADADPAGSRPHRPNWALFKGHAFNTGRAPPGPGPVPGDREEPRPPPCVPTGTRAAEGPRQRAASSLPCSAPWARLPGSEGVCALAVASLRFKKASPQRGVTRGCRGLASLLTDCLEPRCSFCSITGQPSLFPLVYEELGPDASPFFFLTWTLRGSHLPLTAVHHCAETHPAEATWSKYKLDLTNGNL